MRDGTTKYSKNSDMFTIRVNRETFSLIEAAVRAAKPTNSLDIMRQLQMLEDFHEAEQVWADTAPLT